MCTSIRVGKFHSRVLSSIPPPSPPVSPAHFHMIVQKILQLCKEMIFTSGIPNEDCVGGNNEKMLPQITSNHLPKRSCKKDTLHQVCTISKTMITTMSLLQFGIWGSVYHCMQLVLSFHGSNKRLCEVVGITISRNDSVVF